jgi:hypothetical protein
MKQLASLWALGCCLVWLAACAAKPATPELSAAGAAGAAGTIAASDAKTAAAAAESAENDAAAAAAAASAAADPDATSVAAAAAAHDAEMAAAQAGQAARSAASAAREARSAAEKAANAAAGQSPQPELAAAQASEAAQSSADAAAAAARAAGNAALAAQVASKTAIARGKAPADFTAKPATISACDTSGSFVIAGDHLARTPEKYLLGTLPASSFGGKGGDAPSGDASQTIEVDFKGLQNANRGLAEITLSMAATDGALRQKRISVEGSTATCTAAKSSAASTPEPTPSGKGPAITFASPGKQPVDESDVCKLPLTLIATGTDAPKLTAASTSILGEAYVGNVQHDSSGKTTSTTVTFAKLPNFKDSMPSSHQMRIDVVLTGKKAGAITIPVTCGS